LVHITKQVRPSQQKSASELQLMLDGVAMVLSGTADIRASRASQTIRDLPQAASAERGEFNRIQELARDAAPKPPPPTLRPDQ
jgi:hypothetical protein